MGSPAYLRRKNLPPSLIRRLSTPARAQVPGIDKRAPAYTPLTQADQVQFAELSSSFSRGMHPLGEAVANLNSRNLPAQLRQVAFSVVATSTVPRLLIPMNPYRMSWLVTPASPTGLLLFSYGFPVMRPGGAGGSFLGIPVGASFQETNGTVSIDDIYVFTVTGNPDLRCLGYEGTLAIESHLNE